MYSIKTFKFWQLIWQFQNSTHNSVLVSLNGDGKRYEMGGERTLETVGGMKLGNRKNPEKNTKKSPHYPP